MFGFVPNFLIDCKLIGPRLFSCNNFRDFDFTSVLSIELMFVLKDVLFNRTVSGSYQKWFFEKLHLSYIKQVV